MRSRAQIALTRIMDEVEWYGKTTIFINKGDPLNLLKVLSILGYEYKEVEKNRYEVINSFTKE